MQATQPNTNNRSTTSGISQQQQQPSQPNKAQTQLATKSTLRMKQNWYIHLAYTRKVRKERKQTMREF